MIRAVLFDLHGVLTSSPWAALAEAGTASGVDQETVLRVMVGDYRTDGDHPWHRLERGQIGLAEYGAAVLELARDAGIELDFGKLRRFNDRIVVSDEMVAKVRRLHADGYRTAVVTNNVKEMADAWRALLPVDELFDAVVDSSSIGIRKPNPAIFRHALEVLGDIAPGEAVFLDDAEGNVEGARAAGLHAVHVVDVDSALAELDRLLETG